MNNIKINLFCLFMIISYSNCYSSDVFLSNRVVERKYTDENNNKITRIQSGIDNYKFISSDGSPIDQAKAKPVKCDFSHKFDFCGNLEFLPSATGFFKDITAMPAIGDVNPIKISVLNYNMHMGGDIFIPLSIISSEVAGTSDEATINSIKLLDPEQGTVNMKLTYAGRYHFGDFCKFYKSEAEPGKGICSIGINAGLKYIELETNTNEKNNSVGGYIEIANTWMFPIYSEDKINDEGLLAIKASAISFKQNTAGVLFPDKVDANGLPIKFDDSYTALSITGHLKITDKFAIQGDYYKALSESVLEDKTLGTITYQFY